MVASIERDYVGSVWRTGIDSHFPVCSNRAPPGIPYRDATASLMEHLGPAR